MTVANNKPGKNHNQMRKRVLYVSAKSFLEKGYTLTTLKEIAGAAEISNGSLANLFKAKEDILAELVKYVIEGQFNSTYELLKDITDDKILTYAAETTLQLHMAESSEQIRDLYAAAYSMPATSSIIQQMITEKLEVIFSELRPELDTKELYKLEIASGGIMRGFLTIPCDMWFTMEQKVESFLETTFLVYRVPDEKIQQTIDFVKQFNFAEIAQTVINGMLDRLEKMESDIE